MNRKKAFQLGLGCLVSALALYFVFRNVRPADLLAAFRSVDYLWIIPCLAVFYFGIWLRGLRWRWLFLPRHEVPALDATGGLFICFAFNSVLPARAGEFARCYFVGKRCRTGISTALGTVVAERLLDACTLLAVCVGCFALAGKSLIPPDLDIQVEVFGQAHQLTGAQFIAKGKELAVLCALLLGGILAVSIPRTRGWILRLLHALPLPETWRSKTEQLLHRFAEGLEFCHHPRRLAAVLLISGLVWLTNALSLLFLAKGFAFQNPMGLAQAFTAVVITSIFIMVPAAPGYWGFYEAGVIVSLLVLGIHPADAVALSYAILLHLTQWVPIVLVGLPWAWIWQRQLRKAAPDGPEGTDGQ